MLDLDHVKATYLRALSKKLGEHFCTEFDIAVESAAHACIPYALMELDQFINKPFDHSERDRYVEYAVRYATALGFIAAPVPREDSTVPYLTIGWG